MGIRYENFSHRHNINKNKKKVKVGYYNFPRFINDIIAVKRVVKYYGIYA